MVDRADGDSVVDVLEITAVEHALEAFAGPALEIALGHLQSPSLEFDSNDWTGTLTKWLMSRRGGRSAAEQTQRAIVEAAARLFAENGYQQEVFDRADRGSGRRRGPDRLQLGREES